MNLQLYNNESIRVHSEDWLSDAAFTDVSFCENSSNEHWNTCLSVQIHEMFQNFIIKKGKKIKIFSFKKNDKVMKSDFGYFSDGEIIYTNSKTID